MHVKKLCSSIYIYIYILKFYLFILIGGQSLHNTVVAPATHQHGSTRCLVFVPHCGSPQNSAPFNPAEEKRIVYTQKISHLFICIFITQIVFPFSALFLDCSSVIWWNKNYHEEKTGPRMFNSSPCLWLPSSGRTRLQRLAPVWEPCCCYYC